MSQERYIFLSHNSVDKPYVEPLVEKLEQHPLARQYNITVWLDKSDLKHGVPYPPQFAEAIESTNCCAFLVFMPDESVRAYVEHEINIAFDRQMNDRNKGKHFPILPVYPAASQERMPLPTVIKTYNYRENIATDDSKVTAILNDVVEALSENQRVKAADNSTQNEKTVTTSSNDTLTLPLVEQWLCFDLVRDGDTVTATSIDEPTETTQLSYQELCANFPASDLPIKLFPSAFTDNGEAPKRLRVRTDDSDLAMLPWAQLHNQTIVEVSSVATHYRPNFNELSITTPLVVIPNEPQKIKPNTHYRLLHEYFNAYLNIRGPIPRVTNVKSFKHALEHHQPDFLYFYGSAKHGKILLDRPAFPSPDEGNTLTLETLGEWIKGAKVRPVVIISLIGEELKHYPRTLAENCRVLWVQSTASRLSSKSKELEDILANTLEKLGQENDLVSLIKDTFTTDGNIKQHLWVYGQSPKLDTQKLQLIDQLRAALLRVMLGREDLKDKLYSQIQKPEHLDNSNCLVYVVTGDEAACPFDVPAQLQQRLDRDGVANSLPLINFPMSLNIDIDADPNETIVELFEGSLLDRSGHIEETFHSELERRGLLEGGCCIAINWSVNLPDLPDKTSSVLVDWLKELADLIYAEIVPCVPSRTILLNAVCIQTTDNSMAKQLQDTANKTLQQYRRKGIGLIRIVDALDKLQDYEIIDFFEENTHWQQALNFDTYDINLDGYTDWIYQRSNQGEFEQTVRLIWQQYQNDYNDYQAKAGDA